MKTTLVALTLCSFAVVAVSGCNKPEAAAPVPAPAPTASQDASTSGQILRPSGGMGAGAGTGAAASGLLQPETATTAKLQSVRATNVVFICTVIPTGCSWFVA